MYSGRLDIGELIGAVFLGIYMMVVFGSLS